MKITPLVFLAQTRIPALCDAFSDALAVASLTVVSGGVMTLTCSAAHGIAIGDQVTVSITDALTPNPITALAHSGAGTDILVTVQYPHNLTFSPLLICTVVSNAYLWT